MNELDLHQGRNPEKVARDYEAFSKFAKWMVGVVILTLLFLAI